MSDAKEAKKKPWWNLSGKQAEVEELQHALHAQKAQLEETQKQLIHTREQLAAEQSKTREYLGSLQTYADQVKGLEAEKEELQKKEVDSALLLKGFKAKAQQHADEFKIAQAQIATLVKDKNTVEGTANEQREKNEQLQEELHQKSHLIESVHQENAILHKQNKLLQKERDSLKETHKTLEETHKQHKTKTDEVITETLTMLDKEREKNTELTTQVEQVQTASQEFQKELQELKKQKQEFQEQIQKLQEQAQELAEKENQLIALKADLRVLSQTLEQTQAEQKTNQHYTHQQVKLLNQLWQMTFHAFERYNGIGAWVAQKQQWNLLLSQWIESSEDTLESYLMALQNSLNTLGYCKKIEVQRQDAELHIRLQDISSTYTPTNTEDIEANGLLGSLLAACIQQQEPQKYRLHSYDYNVAQAEECFVFRVKDTVHT